VYPQGQSTIIRAGLAVSRPATQKWGVAELGKALTIDELQSLQRILSTEGQIQNDYFRRIVDFIMLNHTKKVLFIGDLQGHVGRLDIILREYGPALESGELMLVFLGDLIHPETGTYLDMAPSVMLFNTVMRLKLKFPLQIVLILGNHDVMYPTKIVSPSEIIRVISDVYAAAHRTQDNPFDVNILLEAIAQLPQGQELIRDPGFEEMIFSKGKVLQSFAYLFALGRQIPVGQDYDQWVYRLQQVIDSMPVSGILWDGPHNKGVFFAHFAVIKEADVKAPDFAVRLYQARQSGLSRQLRNNTFTPRAGSSALVCTDTDAIATAFGVFGGPDNRNVGLLFGHEKVVGNFYHLRIIGNTGPALINLHGNTPDHFGALEWNGVQLNFIQLPLDSQTTLAS
jgi:hypothetical protein